MRHESNDENLRERMRAFYATSKAYKRLLDSHDEAYAASYVALVDRFAPKKGRLLELGGGNGTAARMLHDRGFRVVGTDVSPLFLADAHRWQAEGLAYAVCDGLELPFPDETFEVVCSNEYIEHVPDAERALDEMRRVLAPGGRVLVLGPNLLSPLLPLRELLHLMRGRAREAVWARSKREAWALARRNARLLRQKRRATTPEFLYRRPDLEDRIIGGDEDSAYLANPADLVAYFRAYGWRLVAAAAGVGWKGRLLARCLPYVSPYLCVVAEKPPRNEGRGNPR